MTFLYYPLPLMHSSLLQHASVVFQTLKSHIKNECLIPTFFHFFDLDAFVLALLLEIISSFSFLDKPPWFSSSYKIITFSIPTIGSYFSMTLKCGFPWGSIVGPASSHAIILKINIFILCITYQIYLITFNTKFMTSKHRLSVLFSTSFLNIAQMNLYHYKLNSLPILYIYPLDTTVQLNSLLLTARYRKAESISCLFCSHSIPSCVGLEEKS